MSRSYFWCSRHRPTRRQRAVLGTNATIFQDAAPYTNAEAILARFHASGCDDIVVVAPLSVIAKLCDLGVKPLWAEMAITTPDDPLREVHANRPGGDCRWYKFVRFRRITRILIEFEDGEKAIPPT